MGRTKTFTGATVTRLFEEKDIPHALAQAGGDYVTTLTPSEALKTGIPEYASYYMEQSLPNRLIRSYKWQQKKYCYPVRSAKIMMRDIGKIKETYLQYLQSQGLPVLDIAYADTGTANLFHIAMVKAQATGLYDGYTGKFPSLTSQTNTDVRLQEVTIEYSSHWINTVLWMFHDGDRSAPSEATFQVDLLSLPELKNPRINVPGTPDIPNRTNPNLWETAVKHENNNGVVTHLTDAPYQGGLPLNRARITGFFVAVDGTERDIQISPAGTVTGPSRPVSRSAVNIPPNARFIQVETGTHITHFQRNGANITYTEQTGTKYVYHIDTYLDMEEYAFSGFMGLDPPLAYRLGISSQSIHGSAAQATIPSYFHLAWRDTGGNLHYVLHKEDFSDAPHLQGTLENRGEIGKFLAHLPIKVDKENLLERPRGDADIKCFKRYGRKIGMPWKQVTKNIYKAIDKDFDKVYNTFLGWYVDMNAEDQVSIRYLYLWFLALYDMSADVSIPPHNPDDFMNQEERDRLNRLNNGGQWRNGLVLNLGDGLMYKEFNFDYIQKNERTGSKADVGKYASEMFVGEKQAAYYYQHSPNQYTEILVQDPEIKFDVTADLNYAILHLEDPKDENKSCVCVPLDIGIFDKHKFKFRHRELLFSRSTKIVVTTFLKIKLKWYQTGLFRIVMTLVIALVSYFFPPTSGFISTLAGTLTGAAVGTTSYAVAAAVLTVIASFLGQAIAGKLLKGKLGQIFQIAMLLYGVYNIGVSIHSMGLINAMRADILTFIGRAGDIYKRFITLQATRMNDSYMRQLEKAKEKRKEEKKYTADSSTRTIRTTWETRGSHVDQGYIVLGETAEELIARTTSVNTGLLPIEYISSMVEDSLALPSINDIVNSQLQRTHYYDDIS